MKILVIDGQGGGVGSQCIAQLRMVRQENWEIWAVGSNTAATAAMLKGGAEQGATGENPIVLAAETADLIIGVIGIAIPHSLLGEVTPRMAEAIGKSRAKKLLIPSTRCNNTVVGVTASGLSELTDLAVEAAVGYISEK